MSPSATLEAPVERASPPVSPAPEPVASGRSTRYRSLDLWRGAACMMLVLYHTTFYVPSPLSFRDASTWSVGNVAVKAANFAWVGVPIFFVVSGYCIAASVDAIRRRPCSLKTYFARRMRRIYPPLWIACVWAVAATLTIGSLWPGLYEQCVQLPRLADFSLWNWLGNVSATESWEHHASGTQVGYLMKNTWTLCYEEQFYAVVGLILAFSARGLVPAAGALCLATFTCRHVARSHGVDLDGFFFQGHWLLFAVGIFLFHQLTHPSRRVWWATTGLFVAGLVYAVIDRARFAIGDDDRHLDEYLFVSCAFALLLLVLRRWDAGLMGSRLLKPLQWCGQRSYSIYLTHYPVVVALSCWLAMSGVDSPNRWLLCTLLPCVAVSLLLGWIFHILVERHFLNAPIVS